MCEGVYEAVCMCREGAYGCEGGAGAGRDEEAEGMTTRTGGRAQTSAPLHIAHPSPLLLLTSPL